MSRSSIILVLAQLNRGTINSDWVYHP